MNDSTDQQPTDDILGQSSPVDAQFRHLIESVPDAIIIADTNGQIVLVNSQAETMFGYRRDDLAGQPLSKLIPRRLRSAHTKNVTDFHSAPQARPMGLEKADLMGLRSDGTEFPVDISLSSFETPSGTVAFAAVRDISKQEEIELALRQSEERYRDYYELAPIAYLTIDLTSGEVSECNETAAQMLRAPKSAIIGKPVMQFYTEESIKLGIAAKGDLLKKGHSRGFDATIKRSDGSLIDVSVDSAIVRRADGKAAFVRSTWRDITEQKQAQRALEASEAKYRMIFENIPDIFYQTDAKGIILEIRPAVEDYG